MKATTAVLGLLLLAHLGGSREARQGDNTVPLYLTVTAASGSAASPLDVSGVAVLDNGTPVQPLSLVKADGPVALSVVFDLSGGMFFEAARLVAATETLLRAVPVDGEPALTFFSRSWRPDDRWKSTSFSVVPILTRLGIRRVWNRPLLSEAEWAMTAVAFRKSRRVLVVVTDGPGRGDRTVPVENPSDLREGASFSETKARDLVDYVDRHDVLVYAIGFEDSNFDETVRHIAVRSGGRAIVLARNADVNVTFREIADELRSQYVLRFSPAAFDGKVHSLQVQPKDRALRIRARQEYTASPRPVVH